MPGNFLIWIGVILVLAGTGWYVLTHPEKVRALRETFKNTRVSAREAVQELHGLRKDLRGEKRLPDEAPANDKLDDLRVGEMVEFAPNEGDSRPDTTVTGAGLYHGLNRRKGTQEYSRRGETWFIKMLDDTGLVIHRPEGFYWFSLSQRVSVGPDGMEVWNEAGEKFSGLSRDEQEERNFVFTWRGTKISLWDVGYYEPEVIAGNLPVTDGMKVKYQLGESPSGIVLSQNNFAGTDFVWTQGIYLGPSIAPFVGSFTRAMARI